MSRQRGFKIATPHGLPLPNVLLLPLWAGLVLIAMIATAAPAEMPNLAATQNKSATNTASMIGHKPPDLSRLEVAHAVMVTVELDFGPKVPSIAEALQQVERRSQADDRTGRTFAILDAYGERTSDGKLHISMHVSTEKPGLASLVFKRTGEVLWHGQIVKGTNARSNLADLRLVILLNSPPWQDWRSRSRRTDGPGGTSSINDNLERTVHRNTL
jgi:hypothetical protein